MTSFFDHIKSLFLIVAPYIVGWFGGFVSSFIGGFREEFFEERKRTLKHRLEVARQVLRICNEASTRNYHIRPKDIENVNSIITDVEGVDQKIGEIMNKFVSIWYRLVEIYEDTKRVSKDPDSTRYFLSIRQEVEDCRKQLVSWANKIRNGK